MDVSNAPIAAISSAEAVWRRVLFNENFQPAWIYDLQTLAFLDVNSAALERYGYSREQFLAMNLKDIRPREDIPALLDRVASFETGRQISGEWRHLRADGTIIYAEVASYEIDFEGKAARIAVINDVTERHLAEEQLKKTIAEYRGLFENAHDAILLISADTGRVLDVNQRACEIYGFVRGEFLGLEISTLFKDSAGGREHLKRTLSQGVCYHFETVQRRKDGSEMFLEINASAITYKDQQAILSINRDVTERKIAEEQLHSREQRRRLHVQRTPLGVIDWDVEFRVRAWNPAAEKIFGFSAEEAVGQHATMLIPPDARVHVERVWKELTSASGGLRSTNTNITRDGRTILCDWYNTPLIDANNQVVGVASLVQEVTETHTTRQQLEMSEKRYRTLANAMPAIVYSTDTSSSPDGFTDFYSQRWYDYTGLSAEESRGTGWAKAVHPDDLSGLAAEFARCRAIGEPCDYEFRLRGKDGAYRWFLSRSIPVRDDSGQIIRWIGTSTDIDDMRRQTKILQTIFDHAPVMISFVDQNGRCVLINRQWESTFGYSAKEAYASDLLPELYPNPAELARVREFIQRADGKTWGDFPTRCADGHVVETEWINHRLPDGTVVGLGIDVTQRRQYEREIQESEQRFRQIAENIEEVLWVMDSSRHILYISPAYEQIWQQSVRSLADDPMSWLEAVHPEDREKAWSDDPLSWDREFRLLRKDGSVRWVHSRAMPIVDSSGRATRSVGVCSDITARKETEAHLSDLIRQRTERIGELERQHTESEKLVATGRMAARVAHEINNPLAGITNSFALLKKSISPNDEYFSYVGKIDKEIARIVHIIRQMYELYRPETESAQQFQVNALLNEVIELLRSDASKRSVRIKLPAVAPVVVILPEQSVRQILLNIIRNAIEASPDGGTIEIALEPAGKSIRISVKDHGSGIDPKISGELFEPFVTTKNTTPSAGLGLGLSVARSLALAIGGGIDFESDPSRGTIFHITLPVRFVKLEGERNEHH